MRNKVLVWDLPVRVFHWGLVVCFVGGWLTAESEKLKLFHIAFGYTGMFLLLFRIVWGLLGTRYARFSSFIYRSSEIKDYLFKIFSQNKKHYIGHNPAGGLVMLVLMGLFGLTAFSGYLRYQDLFDFEELHEGLANLTLAFVFGHVFAAIVMSKLEKQNLIKSMVTGRKEGQSSDAIKKSMVPLGILILLAAASFFYLLITHQIPILTQ